MSVFDSDRFSADGFGSERSGPDRSDHNNISGWFDAALEAYVDGELPSGERRRVESYAAAHPHAADQLRIAQTVRRELGAVESPACPPELTAAVMAQARAEAGRRTPSVSTRLAELWAAFLRPTLAAAALAAIVVAGALVGRTPPHPTEQAPAYSAEVERALQETKWALAFVTDVSREAGESIRRDVLEERVTQPIRKALGVAFDDEPTS